MTVRLPRGFAACTALVLFCYGESGTAARGEPPTVDGYCQLLAVHLQLPMLNRQPPAMMVNQFR